MIVPNLKRFGVSIEKELLASFDNFIKKKKYKNRSEAVRDLIRQAIITEVWENSEQVVAGIILLFYDHYRRDTVLDLMNIQHDMNDLVLAVTHFHLDQHNCLEVIVVKGFAKDLRNLSSRLTSIKGVYGTFTVAPAEKV